MLSTYVSYQLIAKDLPKALDRIENQPVVDRETKYYQENITKVTSIEDFVKDDRLFRYAMKAHGLEEMTYAKAFMVKALKEGVSDPDSFANKLSDKRYAEFVTTFNFAERGSLATVYNKAQHETPANYAIQAEIAGDSGKLRFRDNRNQLLSRQHRQGEICQGFHGRQSAPYLRNGSLPAGFHHGRHGIHRKTARRWHPRP